MNKYTNREETALPSEEFKLINVQGMEKIQNHHQANITVINNCRRQD